MPRLPENMCKRPGRRAYYFRRRIAGGKKRKEQWVSLGTDFEEACRRLRQLQAGDALPRSQVTVKLAAKRWLQHYIATTRQLKGRITTASRAAPTAGPAG